MRVGKAVSVHSNAMGYPNIDAIHAFELSVSQKQDWPVKMSFASLDHIST